jgi:hypothetical protein
MDSASEGLCNGKKTFTNDLRKTSPDEVAKIAWNLEDERVVIIQYYFIVLKGSSLTYPVKVCITGKIPSLMICEIPLRTKLQR